jgi:hypothetical protein
VFLVNVNDSRRKPLHLNGIPHRRLPILRCVRSGGQWNGDPQAIIVQRRESRNLRALKRNPRPIIRGLHQIPFGTTGIFSGLSAGDYSSPCLQ